MESSCAPARVRSPVEDLQLTIESRKKLNNGGEIPVLGLGVYQLSAGRVAQEAVKFALQTGYRHIDTAAVYGNERDVGAAVRDSGIPREDIFVTTKLWNNDHGYERAIKACNHSLSLLGFDYVDLYLIHWPVSGLRMESWRALTTLQKEGKCRAIGVSNYTIKHLQELMESSPVVPSVNQVEFNPFLYQEELMRFCEENEIQLEGYSPLTRGMRLRHPVLVETRAAIRAPPHR